MIGWISNFFTIFSSEEKNSPLEKNNNSSLKSKESLAISSTQRDSQYVLLDDQSGKNTTNPSLQTNLQFSEGDVKKVLRDFEKLDYNDSKCFNKIAEKYRKERGLFDYVVLSKQKEIINILDNKLPDLKRQEEFRKRLGEYIFLRIGEGMSYGEELLNQLEFFKR